MEHKPLKSPIGKKVATIWEAYQEVLAELKGKESVPDTNAASKADRAARAVETAEKVDVDHVVHSLESVTDGLLRAKSTFDELKAAIEDKKSELEHVHRIEAEANSLAALVAIKDGLIAQRSEQAAQILEDAKQQSADIIQKAKDEATEAHKTLKLKIEEDSRLQDRQNEEWEYEFARKRKAQLDTVQDDIDAKMKVLAAREEAITEREAQADKLQAELADLQTKLDEAEDKALARIIAAAQEAKDKADKAAQIQKSFAEKALQSEINVLETKNQYYLDQIKDLQQRLERADAQVRDANTRVAEMATNALKAGADAATVAKVSEIAAGAGGKK